MNRQIVIGSLVRMIGTGTNHEGESGVLMSINDGDVVAAPYLVRPLRSGCCTGGIYCRVVIPNPHVVSVDGEFRFQSDKYPTTPAGKVPLSVSDPTAQDLLRTYARRRRVRDVDFSDALDFCLDLAAHEGASGRDSRFEGGDLVDRDALRRAAFARLGRALKDVEGLLDPDA
jgi:hypothetical protein